MSNIKFSLLPSYETYPESFSPEGIELRNYIKRGDEREAVDKESGLMLLIRELDSNRQVLHDSKTYTKFFQSKEPVVKNMSTPAFNLFFYIANSLKPCQRDICINEYDFLSYFDYKEGSRRLYYQAVTELIEKKVLARKAGASRCYWINSNVLFNGDRTKI